MSADFTLERDAFGRLILTDAAGRAHTGVAAVRGERGRLRHGNIMI